MTNAAGERSTPTFPRLVCPSDRLPLQRLSDGAFVCAQGHRYSNHLDIPRLVRHGSNYADAFGAQWKHFRTTQLDSHTGTSISRDRLRRCLGNELIRQLHGPQRVDVLEVGCGAGRFTEILLDMPASAITSTDLSAAVEANVDSCPQSDRHRVVQCDVNASPFAPRQFDLVVCLGVVQHTPDPERTIANLYEQVKPAGWLIFDHYTHTLQRHTKIGEMLLRPLLKRLPARVGMAATHTITDIFFPLHRAARASRLAQVWLSRVSPLSTYYHTIPELNDQQQYEWSLLDTHDGLTDYYRHLRTGPRLRRALVNAGAQDISIERGGNGLEIRCRRP